MIKIGPTGKDDPEVAVVNWDDGGRGELSHIYLSFNTTNGIIAIQFCYIKDGKAILTDQYGALTTGDRFETIELKYPEEYLTRIKGQYITSHRDSLIYPHIRSIKFTTNLAEYGPYGEHSYNLPWFEFGLGKSPHQFGGFYGTHNSRGIHSIGVYLKSITPKEEGASVITLT